MPVSPSSALQIVINNPGKLELGSPQTGWGRDGFYDLPVEG